MRSEKKNRKPHLPSFLPSFLSFVPSCPLSVLPSFLPIWTPFYYVSVSFHSFFCFLSPIHQPPLSLYSPSIHPPTSTHPPTHPSIHPSLPLSLYVFIPTFTYTSIPSLYLYPSILPSLYLYPSIHPSLPLSVPTHPSIPPSLPIHIHPYLYLYIPPSLYLYPSIHPSISPSLPAYTHPLIHPSIHPYLPTCSHPSINPFPPPLPPCLYPSIPPSDAAGDIKYAPPIRINPSPYMYPSLPPCLDPPIHPYLPPYLYSSIHFSLPADTHPYLPPPPPQHDIFSLGITTDTVLYLGEDKAPNTNISIQLVMGPGAGLPTLTCVLPPSESNFWMKKKPAQKSSAVTSVGLRRGDPYGNRGLSLLSAASHSELHIYGYTYTPPWTFLFLYNPSLLRTPPPPTSSLSLSLSPCPPRSFICPSSPWQALCGQLFLLPLPLFPSISAIIAFHPVEYRDGNSLTLLLRGDTIQRWLIEVPSESQRRRKSCLSHSLTGQPLYCFIDRRQ